jgi:hypothetical protein
VCSSDLIPSVANTTSIRSAEFVRLTIQSTTTATESIYTFSSSYQTENVYVDSDGDITVTPPNTGTYTTSTFLPMGGLLGVGEQHRDLRATSFDTNITLTGLDPAGYSSHDDPGGANTTASNIALVLSTPIRGSEIEIFRGFYNTNYNLVEFVPRFKGIITGYTIQEDVQDGRDIFTVNVNCSSYKKVLENNVGGRRTNSNEWEQYVSFYGTDTSMVNIEKLNGSLFDFGKKV